MTGPVSDKAFGSKKALNKTIEQMVTWDGLISLSIPSASVVGCGRVMPFG